MLPYGYGELGLWQYPSAQHAAPMPFGGPAVGLDVVGDSWGALEVLAPHPALVVAAHLRPAPTFGGFVLIDSCDSPALVGRVWQQELLADDELSDHEHRFSGMEVIARPDIFEAGSTWAIGEPLSVLVTS